MKKQVNLQERHKQDGAVLIFSIILLLVMTLLGLSSLNNSSIQEKMSANAQEYNRTFQASESALALEVNAAINRASIIQLGLARANTGVEINLAAPAGLDPGVTTAVTVRHDGEVVLGTDSFDADQGATNINGQHFVFRAISTVGNDVSYQTRSEILQGLDFF